MIRIRVWKAYELAVAAAAILLAIALAALIAVRFSGGDVVTTGAPVRMETESEYLPADGSVLAAGVQEEMAQAVFSSSAALAQPLFGQESTLRVPGEAIPYPLRAQGEDVIAWEKAPRVLIYHTHTFEAYTMEEDGLYEETEKWRTADNAYNVVRVGAALAEELRLRGIDVVHDSTNHELPVLATAYSRSLETLSARMEEGEHYELCIDLHRDAYSAGGGENTVDTAQGRAARYMFLVGRGENFAQRPDAEANERLAWQMTEHMNALVPGLCKDVLGSENRYNQHIGERAVLVEAGNNMNTLTEVLRAVPYLADAIASALYNDAQAPPQGGPELLLLSEQIK